jgi:multidrug efflux pump subunit AcrA (membrane-fusion protein)
MNPICATLAVAVSVLSFAVATPLQAHTPGHAGTPHAGEPRLVSEGTDLELVAKLAGEHLVIYLDQRATNEPVTGAKIEVSGEGIPPTNAESSGEGIYTVEAPWSEVPGNYALVFTVTSGDTIDLLNGVIEISAPPAPKRTIADGLPAPSILILLAGAALLGFLLAFLLGATSRQRWAKPSMRPGSSESSSTLAPKHAACVLALALAAGLALPTDVRAHGSDEHGPSTEASATDDAPHRLPDGSAIVPKPTQRLLQIRTVVAKPQSTRKGRELTGTVLPDPSSLGQVQAPMDGRIEIASRGVSHVGQQVSAGEVLALLSPTIPVADLGTMQQLTAEVEGKLNIAEQKLARLSRISSVIAQKEIDDTRTEIEALRKQKQVLAPKDAELIELKAPVSGVISVANVRAGQVVMTRDTLFEIVDPARLWVEAISTAEHDINEITAAHATDGEGHVIPLTYIGRAPALRQQSLPLQFKVAEAHKGLAIGSNVKVTVQHGDLVEGIVLSEATIVRGTNGLPQVWSKTGPELFKPLAVQTVPLDGSHVLVVAGIEPGTRVVTDGAELINQIR